MTSEEINYHKDILQKELALIQDVIKRMAANSFQIKAWAIALFSAIVAFSLDKLANQSNPALGILTSFLLLVPVISFWWLDAFFLQTEQLYRNLYKWVVLHRKHNPEAYLYDLNTFKRDTFIPSKDANGNIISKTQTLYITDKNIFDDEKKKEAQSIWDLMKSKTIWRFYLSPFLFVSLLLLYNTYNCYLKPVSKQNTQPTTTISTPQTPHSTPSAAIKDSINIPNTPRPQ